MQCWVRALFLPEIRLQLAAVTLAEELNFTRAAERLRITQPALSKQVFDLESQVGFVIFQRSQRRVELTDAGQVFIRGRIKDLIIIRGMNHYPQDIERTVQDSHPALQRGCGAAFSVTDETVC